ncbi:SRPBCC family protein [Rubrolithibacter danxiaensis]|uniref:SRPBCC family protein n=1 Tax=Rubrolithibacter danxiaensis TaxID=3390805 RepID=UPI003BF89DBE
MTVFESKAVIKKPLDEVYTFLSNLNNHKQLMPDTVTDWSSNPDEASFTIKNMAKLTLQVVERIENTLISIVATPDAPFKTQLRWTFSNYGHQTTQVTYTLSAELNMMLKMLASGPLQKLVDYQTQQLHSALD